MLSIISLTGGLGLGTQGTFTLCKEIGKKISITSKFHNLAIYAAEMHLAKLPRVDIAIQRIAGTVIQTICNNHQVNKVHACNAGFELAHD